MILRDAVFMYASEPMANPHRNESPIYMCSQHNKQKEWRTPEWCIPACPKSFAGVPSACYYMEHKALLIPEKHWNAQAVSEQHKDPRIWSSEDRTSNRRTCICKWISWDICVFMCSSHCSSKTGTSLEAFTRAFRPSLFFGDRLVVGDITESASLSVLGCLLCLRGGLSCSGVVYDGDPLRESVKNQ